MCCVGVERAATQVGASPGELANNACEGRLVPWLRPRRLPGRVLEKLRF
jgi:hypothetical protein